MEPEFTAIGCEENFHFACHPEVSCFNACCHNLYQALTPYDVLRLKRFLGLDSGEFIKRFTLQSVGPETGLPVVSLRPVVDRDMACPFVTPDGCKVYPDRPSSCRIYPLARAVVRCRQTGKKTEHYALLKEAHCCGFNSSSRQSVNTWLADQALTVYNVMNDLFLDVITVKNRYRPGALDPVTQRCFHMAMYDLDAFRDDLKNGGRSCQTRMNSCKAADSGFDDDVELLKFGYRWISEVLKGK